MYKSIFFVHVMKTAGTSARVMMERKFREELYPNSRDLKLNPRREYLAAKELVELSKTSDDLSQKKVIFGHYPCALALSGLVVSDPFVATFLRDPLERSISMVAHRLRNRQLPDDLLKGKKPLRDVILHQDFMARQIVNYQTKVFSLEDPLVDVNEPAITDSAALDRAKLRISEIDFVGITENFKESMRLLESLIDVRFNWRDEETNVGVNKASIMSHIDSEDRDAFEESLEYDYKLYDYAKELLENKLRVDCA